VTLAERVEEVYYKENPTNACGKIDPPWSLDDTVPGTDGLRRIDTVSEPTSKFRLRLVRSFRALANQNEETPTEATLLLAKLTFPLSIQS